jgi:hypothetical protein
MGLFSSRGGQKPQEPDGPLFAQGAASPLPFPIRRESMKTSARSAPFATLSYTASGPERPDAERVTVKPPDTMDLALVSASLALRANNVRMIMRARIQLLRQGCRCCGDCRDRED